MSDGHSPNRSLGNNLPLVVCECGAKILLVPDLNEMARSIAAHAETHKKAEADPKKAQEERCRIEELLTQRALILIGKKNRN